MNVMVNGQMHVLSERCSVKQFAGELLQDDPAERSVAIAVNGEVIPRSLWAEVMLENLDVLEVVAPVAGG